MALHRRCCSAVSGVPWLGVRRSSTFTRGKYDPFNALTSVFTPKRSGNGALNDWSVSIKENIAMRGAQTTCASKMLEEYKSPFDATVVRLLCENGACITSRNNCDEFAMGGLNIYSSFGPVANPAPYTDMSNPDFDEIVPHSPGGSSGGAAAAVRAGLCRVAIGTDTGGSVRLPASFCGVYGYKPSYGLISRWGVVAYADSLDTVGVLARNIHDIRAVHDAIAVEDAHDPTCVDQALRNRVQHEVDVIQGRVGKDAPLSGLRVGILAETFPMELDQRIAHIVDDALSALESLGATLVPLSIPAIAHGIGAYYVLALAEATSNLARFDGTRYGFRETGDFASYHAHVSANRADSFGREVRRRILLGTYALSSNAWNSYYLAANQVRSALVRQLRAVWSTPDLRVSNDSHFDGPRVDVCVNPTALQTALRLDSKPSNQYAQEALTVAANLAGQPTVSAPARQTLENGGAHLPVGISFKAQWGHEKLLFDVIDTLHQHTNVLA